jgi:hypothetical protein
MADSSENHTEHKNVSEQNAWKSDVREKVKTSLR